MTSKGGAGIGVLLSVIAIVAVGVFMFWLNQRVAELPDPDAAVVEEAPLTAADVLAGSGPIIGRRAQFDSIPVAMGLGRAVFSVALDDSTAYPVLLNADWVARLQARETRMYGGDRVSVLGQIFSLNDSIRVEWVNQGAVDQGMVVSLPRTSSFLLADSVEVH
jgi:hypothetical protein